MVRPAAWRRLMLLAAAVAAAVASAPAAEASCAVCVRTAAELEAQVEMVSSGRAAVQRTVGLCASTAAEPLRLDRSISVAGFGLAVDLTISCCAGAGAKCGIERTAPSAGFNFAASTGGVTFTAQDIAFTQAAAAGSPTAPLVGAADTIVADPAVRFLGCRFEGISGSLVPGAVDEDFGAVLNLPFVLTAAPGRDVFESVGCTYVANNSTGAVVSLANLTPAGFGARYAVADADFFGNGAVAVATRRDGGGPGLDELHIESSYFYRNAGGAVLARDLGAFVLRGSFVHEHALGGASAAVELLQKGTAPSGSCVLEGDEFRGNANADQSYYAQSAALSVTGYERVEIAGSAFSSNFGATATGAAVAVAAFDPLAPGFVTAPAGEVRIDSCSFVDNAVEEGASGGTVSLSNIRRTAVADSLFSRNYGSALTGFNSYYDEDAPDAVSSRLYLVNSTFEDNAGGGNDGGGGVIMSQMEEVVLEDCLFVGQTGTGSGAALFVSNGLGSLDVGAVSIRRTRFERNTIPRTFMFGGGAVMLLSVGRMDIAGSEFYSNSINGTSGGAFAAFTSGLNNDTITLTISDSSFANNSVSNVFGSASGGAVFATVSVLNITGSSFVDNFGGQYGGAVEAALTERVGPGDEGLQRVAIAGNLFRGNQAVVDGGALFLTPLVLAQPGAGIAEDNVFEDNLPNDINEADL